MATTSRWWTPQGRLWPDSSSAFRSHRSRPCVLLFSDENIRATTRFIAARTIPPELHFEICKHLSSPQLLRFVIALWICFLTYPQACLLYLSKVPLLLIGSLLNSAGEERLLDPALKLLLGGLDAIHSQAVWVKASRALLRPILGAIHRRQISSLSSLLKHAHMTGYTVYHAQQHAISGRSEEAAIMILEFCGHSDLRKCLEGIRLDTAASLEWGSPPDNITQANSLLWVGIHAYRKTPDPTIVTCLERVVDTLVEDSDQDWAQIFLCPLSELARCPKFLKPVVVNEQNQKVISGKGCDDGHDYDQQLVLIAPEYQRRMLQLILRIPGIIPRIADGTLSDKNIWEMLPIPLLDELIGQVSLSDAAKVQVLERVQWSFRMQTKLAFC
ncbi:hypothetical protein FN846DRAFT_920244 [Sphaerosporella brunnea]|uniref:Uncharacterized protein n=1 Tax=Sphaerosporella brunnea TaxID=1250544 RepID=A0A5J5ET62_9PEZI|nr:hypothetical protein FN846DRAFT_920244 [Sphaerosporella brunnea]